MMDGGRQFYIREIAIGIKSGYHLRKGESLRTMTVHTSYQQQTLW
jgi:hypothetical protein